MRTLDKGSQNYLKPKRGLKISQAGNPDGN